MAVWSHLSDRLYYADPGGLSLRVGATTESIVRLPAVRKGLTGRIVSQQLRSSWDFLRAE